MKYILGKKIDMTQVWRGDELIAVTRVQAGPCRITQLKSKDNDGYIAAQVAYGDKKAKNTPKPQAGHFKKAGLENTPAYMREFRLDKNGQAEGNYNIGDTIDVTTFNAGDIIKVTSVSKGKGFQGVVKRYGFSGSKKTHGNKDQERMPGSNGATGPAHVFKGVRMPGRTGGKQVSTANLEIIEIDEANNILLIKGSIPGARNGLVMISGKGELKIAGVKKAEEETSAADLPENIEKVVEEAHEKVSVEEKAKEKLNNQ